MIPPSSRHLLAFLTLLTVGALSETAAFAACHATSPTEAPWRRPVTFSDDFNDLSVSARGPGTRWTAHTPWNGDFGDAQFTDPEPGFPFTVERGILAITARKDASGNWRSGLLSSTDKDGVGFSQRYGYFEIRTQVPAGEGIWSAFWLAQIAGKGPPDTGVEIDILEYYGRGPRAFQSTIHLWPPEKGRTHPSETRWTKSKEPLAGRFHTYGADVGPECTDFYLDRRKVQSLATPSELRRPLGILVNLALGSGWPIDKTPSPSVMKVDYVRVFAPASNRQ